MEQPSTRENGHDAYPSLSLKTALAIARNLRLHASQPYDSRRIYRPRGSRIPHIIRVFREVGGSGVGGLKQGSIVPYPPPPYLRQGPL